MLSKDKPMLLKDRIQQHYDEVSAIYKDIWGVHIHHGYWVSGTETKEEAQEQLIKELIARAGIKNGSRILDVGCGMGGSAIFLSKTLGAHVTGITISPVQVEIGNALAREHGADVHLMQMDAEALDMEDRFDVVWSVEAISHLSNRGDSFRSIARLLEQGGQLVIADWFKSPTATAAQEREILEPIERAMLVPKLDPLDAYADYISQAGLTVTLSEDLSAHVSKTWDLAIELIRDPALWKFAEERGQDFVAFLEGFAAMRAGYGSKAFLYGALVGHKP
jgi:tocopherol O-methyltransferase